MVRSTLAFTALGFLSAAVTLSGGPGREAAGIEFADLIGTFKAYVERLEIRSDGSFCFKEGSDIGVLQQGCGRVAVKHGRVSFRMAQSGAPSLTGEPWFAIPWGQRMYLVAKSDLMDFVNSVNQGNEPLLDDANGVYLLRTGDPGCPPDGLPQLPDRWRDFLLLKVVTGSVIRVDDTDLGQINVGKSESLLPGMELWVQNNDGRDFPVRVTQVKPRTAEVHVERWGEGPLLLNQTVSSRDRVMDMPHAQPVCPCLPEDRQDCGASGPPGVSGSQH